MMRSHTPLLPKVLAGVTMLLAGGCKQSSVAGPDVQLLIDRCPVQGCGSNTPELSGARFIEALNLDGVPTFGFIRIDPASFRAPRCGPGAYRLDLRDGALVGLDASGAVACAGDALIGASLTLTAGPQRHRLHIAEVGSVSTLHRDAQQRRLLPTYQLEWDNRRPVCPDPDARWLDPGRRAGLPDGRNPPGVGGRPWQARTRHALLVQGEAYDAGGNVDPARSTPRWFTLACAGAAFAKMRLFGYDPMARDAASQTTREQRQATLKMITARYTTGPSRTKHGVPVLWLRAPMGFGFFGEITPDSVTALGPVEAMWNGNGAVCLSHLRLWRRTDPRFATQADAEAAELAPLAPCPTMFPEIFELPTGVEWVTFTINHVRHNGEPPIGPLPH